MPLLDRFFVVVVFFDLGLVAAGETNYSTLGGCRRSASGSSSEGDEWGEITFYRRDTRRDLHLIFFLIFEYSERQKDRHVFSGCF